MRLSVPCTAIIVAIVIVAGCTGSQPAKSTTTTAKIRAVCGNGVCDAGESGLNCCNDCSCASDEICNQRRQRCETDFPLTDIDAEIAVRQHIGAGNYTVEVGGVGQHQNKKVIYVYVYTPETKLFAVDEDNVVTEIELDL